MTNTSERNPRSDGADLDHSSAGPAARRGEDDRKGRVNPAENPAPSSPAPDEEAVRKGEQNLDRVKPY